MSDVKKKSTSKCIFNCQFFVDNKIIVYGNVYLHGHTKELEQRLNSKAHFALQIITDTYDKLNSANEHNTKRLAFASDVGNRRRPIL